MQLNGNWRSRFARRGRWLKPSKRPPSTTRPLRMEVLEGRQLLTACAPVEPPPEGESALSPTAFVATSDDILPYTSYIVVHVIDADHQPVQDAQVELRDGFDAIVGVAATDDRGIAKFPDLMAGTYKVQAAKEGVGVGTAQGALQQGQGPWRPKVKLLEPADLAVLSVEILARSTLVVEYAMRAWNAPFQLSVYASADAVFDSADRRVAEREFQAEPDHTGRAIVELPWEFTLDPDRPVLLVVAEGAGPVPEADVGNNTRPVPMPLVSHELHYRAPLAPTAEQRVSSWLGDQAERIKTTAARFRIDPRAVAGAIAWEALFNVTDGKPPLHPVYGPGKVHFYPNLPQGQTTFDAEAVEGTHRYGDYAYLPVREFWLERPRLLRTSEGAITYIAAIMNAYAVEAETAGYSQIRRQPEILGTFFNGVRPDELDGDYLSLGNAADYFMERRHDPAPLAPNAAMGRWIADKLAYLGAAIGLDVWRNPSNRHDVDGDERVTATDLLALVHHLRNQGAPPTGDAPQSTPPLYLDVNGDGGVSLADLLELVTALRAELGRWGDGPSEA